MAEIHGPQEKWKKETEKINERAARGPLKNWTNNQRIQYALELLEVRTVNYANTLSAEMKHSIQVGAHLLRDLPSPFEEFETLEGVLLDMLKQTEELAADYRQLCEYARDYRNQKGLFECHSPAAKSTTDPLSSFLVNVPVTQF